MKIGLLGGTFDPIHNGHLAIAKTALKRLGLDQVWFVPSLKTPLKDRELTPFELRVTMMEKALRPYRKMKLCLIEKDLPTPSYTITTVKTLKKQYPDDEFVWIIGDDQYANLDQWKAVDELCRLVQFAVFSRQGIAVKQPGFLYVENFSHPASSTAVRQGAFKDVPKAVRQVMLETGLYVEEIAKAYCHPRRYQHCVTMSALAVELAKAHGVNPRKAYVAGMLHDLAKGLDEETARGWIEVYWPQARDQAWKIWHQYIGATWLKTRLYLYDQEILEAVAWHTTGEGKSDLAKIIYIADKIDPGRGYDITRQKAVCLQDLDQGFRLIQQEQKAYLRKEGLNV